MSAKQALSIEPHLKVHNPGYQFLYSPTTSVADNKGIMRSIVRLVTKASIVS